MTTKMAPLFEHLALVFHRFTQAEAPRPAVTITVNSLPLPPRDPFLGGNQFRQQLEGQTIQHERGTVSVQPFILPAVSNLTAEEVETAGGREGLRGTQGFYVYRGRRLVIWGTWFGLVPKEEFFKLTRVRVDIPNTFDDLWALDIKKSAAHPPDPIRSRLKELIPHFASTSRRVVTYKGRIPRTGGRFVPLWLPVERSGRTFRYEVNEQHPLIQRLSQAVGDEGQRQLQMTLDILGAAIPYQGIYADMCADRPRRSEDELLQELIEMAASLREVTALSIDRILEIDPLSAYPELHQRIREELEL
jgi:hypothetical protein